MPRVAENIAMHAPLNLVLKLSKLCNLRCTYCYEYDHLGDKARMPLPALGRFLTSFAAHCGTVDIPAPIQFVLHGGEPALLPADYLRAFVDLQRQTLGAAGIPYRNALQTNLYRVKDQTLDLLKELGISMSVSTDVAGAERVTGTGADAEARVKVNLDRLLDSERSEGLLKGAIAVLHAGNSDKAIQTFEYFADRKLSYRILPIFAMTDAPERMRQLMLSPQRVVEALKQVALASFSRPGKSITIYPLQEYLMAAVHHLRRQPVAAYDPEEGEWALIIDTNGDVYNHGEAYLPNSQMGNVFRDSFDAIMRSEGRRRALAVRRQRQRVCEFCDFARSCTRVPMIEAVPSERGENGGSLNCTVAKPMIDFFIGLVSQTPGAMALIDESD